MQRDDSRLPDNFQALARKHWFKEIKPKRLADALSVAAFCQKNWRSQFPTPHKSFAQCYKLPMAGRIKRRISEQLHEAAQAQQEVIVICPLCTREIPESEMESHHLIPKSKGGRDTEYLHRICHRQIHALFTETELARHYQSVEALLEHPEIASFVKWLANKPPDFYERATKSQRTRKR
jgi:hypothetical protein